MPSPVRLGVASRTSKGILLIRWFVLAVGSIAGSISNPMGSQPAAVISVDHPLVGDANQPLEVYRTSLHPSRCKVAIVGVVSNRTGVIRVTQRVTA